jgi:hypothetical protein
MGMDVNGAAGHGIPNAHVAFQPLMHVSTLSNVDRNPVPILALRCINEVAGQWPESSVNRVYSFPDWPGQFINGEDMLSRG